MDTTLNVYPGAVTTWAGNGTNATVDGNGTAASFTAMGGVTTVGTTAYVATAGAIRTVNLTPGGNHAVGTIAGAGGLSPTIGGIATDGTSLFTADVGNAKIWKTNISTGVTSALTTGTAYYTLTYGGGHLYAACVTCAQVWQIDTTTGARTQVGSNTGGVTAMTNDGTNLWITEVISCGNPCKTDLLELDLAGNPS